MRALADRTDDRDELRRRQRAVETCDNRDGWSGGALVFPVAEARAVTGKAIHARGKHDLESAASTDRDAASVTR